MTQFTPKHIEENVNVTPVSAHREFFVLTGGILGIIIGIYFILGIALEVIIDRAPEKFENALSRIYPMDQFPVSERHKELQGEIQKLVDELALSHWDDGKSFTVNIVDSSTVNAMAAPGGNIILYTGLLEEVESENELAMILAHELGHYANHDHLRALGRGIVLIFISAVLLGTDSSATSFFSGAINMIDLKFSRTQEERADEFGLKLIQQKYGHAAGATDFFQRMSEDSKLPKVLGFISTHPISESRVSLIESNIADWNYSVGEKKALAPIYEESLSDRKEDAEEKEEPAAEEQPAA